MWILINSGDMMYVFVLSCAPYSLKEALCLLPACAGLALLVLRGGKIEV